MLDDDIVAVSPSSTYRVLKTAGRLDRKIVTPSKKGTGYIQPTKIHQEWHVDVSYINAGGTFYFLISVLDGYSRYIVHQELRETMKELDIELVIAKGTEKHPGVKPRIISDNGPQFIAKDFKEFVREYCLTHVRTSPYYPQSNGKLERWHGSLKSECIRPSCPATKDEAEKRIAKYVGFFALLKKQADMLERSQGLPKQPLACFLTPVALELVPTSRFLAHQTFATCRDEPDRRRDTFKHIRSFTTFICLDDSCLDDYYCGYREASLNRGFSNRAKASKYS